MNRILNGIFDMIPWQSFRFRGYEPREASATMSRTSAATLSSPGRQSLITLFTVALGRPASSDMVGVESETDWYGLTEEPFSKLEKFVENSFFVCFLC
jgi:hypothetical protein